MEKIVKIGGKDITLKASALLPRLYRSHIGKDLINDMAKLQKSIESKDNLDALDLEIFENIAWCMAYHADKTIPNTPDEWLETIDGVFDIYTVLPTIIELWANNNVQTSQSVKK